MKTRLTILIAVAIVAAACSSNDASNNAGFLRTTTSGAQTTSTPTPADSTVDTTPTSIDGALPTNPEQADSGGTDTPDVTVAIDVEPCEPPTENLAPYCQPFELVLGDTRIVWDRWFWGQGIFSKGTVEVFHGDELVAAGPFVGEGSIVEQDENDRFIFYDPEGSVVAIATPDDITPAIQDVLDDLNS
jgi:uncharacterized protein YdeI (BOF family)